MHRLHAAQRRVPQSATGIASRVAPESRGGHAGPLTIRCVIHDAGRSLAAWLTSVLPDGIAVSLDPPDPAWAQRGQRQRLANAFLFDIREDPRGLASSASMLRNDDGLVGARRSPTRQYRLSYLVSAWAATTAAEHEILGTIMAGCAADDVIPQDCLYGSLLEAGLPIALQCAPAEPAAEPSEIWRSLALPARTMIVIVLAAPLVPVARDVVAPPVRRLDLDVLSAPDGLPRPAQPERKRWERGRIIERHD
jgi:hypothetical protein